MPYISRTVDKRKIPPTKVVIPIICVIFAMIFLGIYFDGRREKKLKNSVETTAVILKASSALNGGAKIEYLVNGKKIDLQLVSGSFGHLKTGDSILIKYAKEDPELVAVVDKYYMKKYEYLKYK